MQRHHMTGNGPVAFTDEEEAEADEADARHIDRMHNADIHSQIATVEGPTGFTRRQREFLIANSAAGPLKTALTTIDDLIAAKRAALKP